MILEEIVVTDLKSIRSVYAFLPGNLNTISSRKGIKKAINKGLVLINNRVAKYDTKIQNGDVITLTAPKHVAKVYRSSLTVHYEDEYIAIIEKPAGWLTSGNQFKTTHNALPFNLSLSKEKDALTTPLPVHRLDLATHGLLLVAKTQQSVQNLGKAFEQRTIQKKYIALVHGYLNCSGELNFPIDGKAALTRFKTLQTIQNNNKEHLSLLALFPTTGRKHQLRVHLSSIGFPIVGDTKYAKNNQYVKKKGLFLSAVGLNFDHPITEEKINLEINLPLKFDRFIRLNQIKKPSISR